MTLVLPMELMQTEKNLKIEKLYNGTVIRTKRAAIFVPKCDYHSMHEIILEYTREGWIPSMPINDEILCYPSPTGLLFHGYEIIDVPNDRLKELL